MTVLRDMRDSQTEPSPSPALLALLPLRRLAATTFGELGGQLLVGHVVIEALHLDCDVTLPCQFCLDRCCHSGSVLLLRCNDFRMVGLAVLFLLLDGLQLLQNTDDLAALQCPSRQERQRRGTITIGNPVHGAFEPNGYVNRSRDMVSPAVYPRLSSHHFDIQSSARKSHCHGYSCRLPALVLNHFDIQATVMRVMVSPVVHPRLF